MTVTFHTGKTELPPAVFEAIADAFRNEPHLLPATGEELWASYWNGLAAVGRDEDGESIAYTRLIPLLPSYAAVQFFELGSTWVRKDRRKRGINHDMYRVLLPLHAEKNILATTTSQDAFDVGKSMGFVLVPRRALPDTVWKATCICPSSKTGCMRKNVSCRLAFGEPQRAGDKTCWLRVTRETARRYALAGVEG